MVPLWLRAARSFCSLSGSTLSLRPSSLLSAIMFDSLRLYFRLIPAALLQFCDGLGTVNHRLVHANDIDLPAGKNACSFIIVSSFCAGF